MVGLLLAVFNGDFSAERVADETEWHKCKTPLLVRLRHGNIGQTMRRKRPDGHWQYKQES